MINKINKGIDYLFDKVFCFIDFVRKKAWLKWILIIFGAFLFSLIFYLIFNIGNGAPEEVIYIENGTYSELKAVSTKAKSFLNTINYLAVEITGWILLGVLLLLFSYIFARKKLDYKWGLIFIVLVAIIVRLVYTNVTDNIFTRQHDVWSNYGFGHYGITMHIYSHNFSLPALVNGNLEDSYQMYHPKYAHYIYALVMKINSLFMGSNARADWNVYLSIRIFTCTLSIITIYVGYSIFKELFKSKVAILISTSVIAFAPSLIRLSAHSNNDPMLYFFLFLAVMFAIKFYKYDGWINIIGAALSIGLAMGSKLSGALIAIPIGVLFVYKFIRIFVDNKGNIKAPLLKIIGYYAVFIAICAPIGLFWVVYNMKEYGQSISYVWHNLNHALLINEPDNPDRAGYEVFTYAEMYLFFDFRTYFNNMFHVGFFSKGMKYLIDYNMYTNAFKTSVFGEHSFANEQLVFCILLYAFGLILAIAALLAGLYFIIKSIIKKQYDLAITLSLPFVIYYVYVFFKSKEIWGYILAVILTLLTAFLIFMFIRNYKKIHEKRLPIIFMGLIFLVFFLSFFDFQLQYPYTCTSDFRYIIMLLIPFGYAMGKVSEHYLNKKAIILPLLFVYGLYCFGSVGLYLSM